MRQSRDLARLDILVNNAGRGMQYVSDSFLTEPTRFCHSLLEDIARDMAADCRHQRQRSLLDGKACDAADGWRADLSVREAAQAAAGPAGC